MHGRMIYNAHAGSSEQIEQIKHLLPDVTWCETSDAEHAIELAEQSAGEKLVIAAGGDGTISQIVNGLMRLPREKRPTLAVLPLGTGNDLARTLNIPPDDLPTAVEIIHQGKATPIDVVEVIFGKDKPRFAINACAGGFTGQMNEVMTDELKQTWGPLAYLRGAIGVLPDMTHHHTSISYDDSPMEENRALNIVVANGRTAGGGMPIAPHADPSDGLLDVVIVETKQLLELSDIAARLVAGGDYTDCPGVSMRKCRSVRIESTPGMWFNVDGELVSKEAVRFEIKRAALDVLIPSPGTPGES